MPHIIQDRSMVWRHLYTSRVTETVLCLSLYMIKYTFYYDCVPVTELRYISTMNRNRYSSSVTGTYMYLQKAEVTFLTVFLLCDLLLLPTSNTPKDIERLSHQQPSVSTYKYKHLDYVKKSWHKTKMIDRLVYYDVQFSPHALKSELYAIIKSKKIVRKYVVDEMAKEVGHDLPSCGSLYLKSN